MEDKSVIRKKPHERALRIVYNDTVTSLENLLVKDKSFAIHQKIFSHQRSKYIKP